MRPGTHIGKFEFLVWSILRRKRVWILFGGEPYDVAEVYGAALPLPEFTSTARVVGCRYFADTCYRVNAECTDLNHWLIGKRKAAGEPPESYYKNLAGAVAEHAGWSIRKTVAQGDCGIDCMAYYDGRPRTAET